MCFLLTGQVTASATNGTIDPNNNGDYIAEFDSIPNSSDTQINFGKFSGDNAAYNITISDNGLRGFAWSEIAGWIVMNCEDTNSGCSAGNGNFAVAVATDGTLSGYAWGQGTGWINFGPFSNNSVSRVKISSLGVFSGTSGTAGHAWSQNYGWINFDCGTAGQCVTTDYIPIDYRDDDDDGGSGGGGGSGSTPTTPTTPPVMPPVTPPVVPPTDPVVPPTDPVIPVNPPDQPEIPFDPGPPPTEGEPIPELPLPTQTPTGDPSSILPSIREVFNRPEVQTAGKTATIIGIAGSIVTPIMSLLLQSPFIFTDFWLFILKIWAFLLSFFGLRRVVHWGVVYDSVTKQPIDPAYVSLVDNSGNEVNSAITDLNGRYGFLAPPGMYTMTAQKTHYQFPSTKLAGKTEDELYRDLYFGAPITITKEDAVIAKNIPMDPVGFDWNEFVKRDRGIISFYARHEVALTRIADAFFILGFAFSVISFILNPSIINGILVLFYITYVLFSRSKLFKPRAGKVLKGNEPYPFVLVEVYNARLNQKITQKITSMYGRFFALLPKGEYYLVISEKRNTPEGGFVPVHKTANFVVKGHVNKTVSIKTS